MKAVSLTVQIRLVVSYITYDVITYDVIQHRQCYHTLAVSLGLRGLYIFFGLKNCSSQ